MPFTSETAKEAGRKSKRKGVPNKTTSEIRERFSAIIDGNIIKYQQELEKLEGKEFILAFNQVLEFALPKLQRIEQKTELEQNNVILNLGNGQNPNHDLTEVEAEKIRQAISDGGILPTDTREMIETKLIINQIESEI
ncbi:MAG: hypothetical protein ACPGLV_15525 [Bacteroidia bacterium]